MPVARVKSEPRSSSTMAKAASARSSRRVVLKAEGNDNMDLGDGEPPIQNVVDDGLNEDDPIVREIDVFLSPELCSTLHLLQYPLQPVGRVGHNVHAASTVPSAARLKPLHHLLELDFPIDNRTPSPDGRFAELKKRTFVSQTIPVHTHLCLGRFLPHPEHRPADHLSANTMNLVDSDEDDDSNLLQSQTTQHGNPNEALYLVPLQHIRQMRPTFDHVDGPRLTGAGAAPSSNTHHGTESADEKSVDTAASDERKPIVYQRKESERALHARQNSYAFYCNSRDQEPVLPLEIGGPIDAQSFWRDRIPIVKNATPPREDARPIPSVWATGRPAGNTDTNHARQAVAALSNESYVRSLDYQSSAANRPVSVRLPSSSSPSLSSSSKSSDALIASLIPRVTRRLLRGTPIPYRVLRSQLIPEHHTESIDRVTDTDLWTALAVPAVLVRGNFVLRSALVPSSLTMMLSRQHQKSLMNESDHVPTDDNNDTSADYYQQACHDPVANRDPLPWTNAQRQARTFLLLLFELYGTVCRTRLAKTYPVAQIAPAVWHQMLCTLGRYDHTISNGALYGSNRGLWKLKIADDTSVMTEFPDQVALHRAYWERQKRRYASRLIKYQDSV